VIPLRRYRGSIFIADKGTYRAPNVWIDMAGVDRRMQLPQTVIHPARRGT
jgi:hypothetical protein